MQQSHSSKHLRPVLEQPATSTTLWIGHLPVDARHHYAGQTFTCPAEGDLDNIQLYAASIPSAGAIHVTLHEFDARQKKWGPTIGESHKQVTRSDDHHWLRFGFPHIFMNRAASYGFRISSDDALIGLGEAAGDSKHPFTFGQVWKADSTDKEGHYYTYFSLAFKIEMRA